MREDHDTLQRRIAALEERLVRVENIVRALLRERTGRQEPAGGTDRAASPPAAGADQSARRPAAGAAHGADVASGAEAPAGAASAAPGSGASRAPADATPAMPGSTAAGVPSPGPGPSDPGPRRTASPLAAGARPWTVDLEQWVGQRALLVVGVLALLAGAGFFLEHAFDRGWIPPVLRVAGAVLSGVAVATLGDRLIHRQLRRYGAALAGAGGGLAYLGFWAAAAAYGLLDHGVALALLALTTAGVGALAVRHRIEGLAAWALHGAYLAPLFLAPEGARYEVLLLYLLAVGLAWGGIARSLQWRATFAVAVAGYFLLPAVLVDRLADPPGVGYLAVGGVVSLLATANRPWAESRVIAFLLAWALLLAVASHSAGSAQWIGAVGVLALAGTVWWQHRGRDPLAVRSSGGLVSYAEPLIFVLSPLALVLWSARTRPPELDWWRVATPALAAVAYLGAGWPRRLRHLVGMGFVLLALAAAAQWDGPPVSVAWTMIGVLAVAADRWAGQTGGRAVGAGIATGAALHLFTAALAERPLGAPAFADPWAWAWYGVTAGAALAASIWRREPHAANDARPFLDRRVGGYVVLWGLAGVTIFAGGSIEIRGVFTSALAADLATSAFWLIYAGALVLLGFTLSVKASRAAGLAVAGLAVAKIGLYDLSSLEALYRVGSLLVLALIALAVAFAYHRSAVRG